MELGWPTASLRLGLHSNRQTILKSRVAKKIDLRRRQCQIDQWISCIDRWTSKALPSNLIVYSIVIQGFVDKTRLGPIRIDRGSSNRIQIELEDIFLPVQDIVEVLGPISNFSIAASMEHVVVAKNPTVLSFAMCRLYPSSVQKMLF